MGACIMRSSAALFWQLFDYSAPDDEEQFASRLLSGKEQDTMLWRCSGWLERSGCPAALLRNDHSESGSSILHPMFRGRAGPRTAGRQGEKRKNLTPKPSHAHVHRPIAPPSSAVISVSFSVQKRRSNTSRCSFADVPRCRKALSSKP